MGPISKARDSVSNRIGRESQAKTARAQAKAAQAQAGLAEAETTVTEEQAAAIARALQEDETHRQADLQGVAEKEAESVPWIGQPTPEGGMKSAPTAGDGDVFDATA